MKRFVLAVLLLLAACKSKEDKINECHAKCEELGKQFSSKCPEMMIDKAQCEKKTAETNQGCFESCDKGLK